MLRELATSTTDLEMGLDENLEPDPQQELAMEKIRDMLLLVEQSHQNSLQLIHDAASAGRAPRVVREIDPATDLAAARMARCRN